MKKTGSLTCTTALYSNINVLYFLFFVIHLLTVKLLLFSGSYKIINSKFLTDKAEIHFYRIISTKTCSKDSVAILELGYTYTEEIQKSTGQLYLKILFTINIHFYYEDL